MAYYLQRQSDNLFIAFWAIISFFFLVWMNWGMFCVFIVWWRHFTYTKKRAKDNKNICLSLHVATIWFMYILIKNPCIFTVIALLEDGSISTQKINKFCDRFTEEKKVLMIFRCSKNARFVFFDCRPIAIYKMSWTEKKSYFHWVSISAAIINWHH